MLDEALVARIQRLARWVAWRTGILEADDLAQAAYLSVLQAADSARATHPRALMQAMWGIVRDELQQHGMTRMGTPRKPLMPTWLPPRPAPCWLHSYLRQLLAHIDTCQRHPASMACLARWVSELPDTCSPATRMQYLWLARRHLRRWDHGLSCAAARPRLGRKTIPA